MWIHRPPPWSRRGEENDVTPRELWLNRRSLMQGAAAALGVAALGSTALAPGKAAAVTRGGGGTPLAGTIADSPLSTRGETLTPWAAATSYNNFYEFGVEKEDPAARAGSLKTRPWAITVDGACARPGVLDLETLLAMPLEERIYRLRCVEAWSMVLPWAGVPLASVLSRFEPLSSARFVRFETLMDPQQMPGQRRPVLQWPYVEGLRMDEALHPLTLLAVGLYGEPLPAQNGAPVRLVVPWKYGFKSIKSIVRITFTDTLPATSWALSAPREYGFYANVNPSVDHPRWSQQRERRLGEFFRRETLMFNGYGDQVASLYKGQDLAVDF